MTHWEMLYPEQLLPISQSILWRVLCTDFLPPDWRHWVARPMSWAVFHALGPFKEAMIRRPTESMVQEVASFGSFDAVAILLLLLLDESQRDGHANALLCARYLPATVALLARTPGGRKTALPIFAMLRQRYLDGVVHTGNTLELATCDLLAMADKAKDLPGTRLMTSPPDLPGWGKSTKPIVPPPMREWLEQNRVKLIPQGTEQVTWRDGLALSAHPYGPCADGSPNRLHPRGQDRLRKALKTHF